MPDPTNPVAPIDPQQQPPALLQGLRVDDKGNVFDTSGRAVGKLPPAAPVRSASTPAAGAVRAGISVTLAQIVSFLVKPYVPADIFVQVDLLITTGVTAGLAYAGKIIRNRFPDTATPV